MFSPVGKKKYLIQQKFGGSTERAISPGSPGSRSPSRGPRSRSSSPTLSQKDDSLKKLRLLAPTSVIAANGALEKALGDVGMTGQIMRKLLEATTRYRPHRDAILLKAFESKTMAYEFFRLNLNSAFWLTFSDEEFQAVINYFDPTKAGIIDGYSFMIAFTRLAAIRKDHEAALVREKQEAFEKSVQDSKERERIEKEKKNELAVDYNYNEATKANALRKLEHAAKNFDPYHPASPSTVAFEVKKIKPAVFKEMLKLTFNLKLDCAELGAIVKEFTHAEPQEVSGIDFMKYFFRVGFEAREEEKRKQRERQEKLDKIAEEERERKAMETKNKNQLKVDYNFSPEEEQSALDKLTQASMKYDRYAVGAVSLDGFDCEELSPSDFRELLKRVFNVQLTNTELGFVIQKYDIKRSGNLHCKTFLTDMLTLGRQSRHTAHIQQLQKQRQLHIQAHKEHLEKMANVYASTEDVSVDFSYSQQDMQNALMKLTHASVKFDKNRGGTLESFECAILDLIGFKRGLKRTFNIVFTPKEMGAIVELLGDGGGHDDVDAAGGGRGSADEEIKGGEGNKSGKGDKSAKPKPTDIFIDCHKFLTTFTTLGAAEKSRQRSEQLKKQRDSIRMMQEEHVKKIEDNLNRTLHADVDFTFTDADRDSALRKMIDSAYKYDAAHPAAMSLQAFEKLYMLGSEFRDTVKKTFFLNLTPKEVGALFGYFRERGEKQGTRKVAADQIDCGEFLKFFLQVGVNERASFHRQQLEKQRKEIEDREAEHKRKVETLANRSTYAPDMQFTVDDIKSIQEKLAIAAEKFDKNHPAAPSLESFDAALMPPGVFRENIKSIFGVKATPKEIGYLMSIYDKDQCGSIHTKDFLIKFFAQGKAIRDDKRKESLIKQQEALKLARQEAELKVLQLTEKSDYQVDRNFTLEDFYEAEKRMLVESEKYDKTHPSAPNLDGFNGPISPGSFRELMKRAFNIYLNPREVGAILQRFHAENNMNIIDGKKFIIYFIRLGYDVRNKRKREVLKEQREAAEQMKREQEQKLQQALQKNELELVMSFTEQQQEEARKKLIEAAALYDKNAPGSVSLTVFHSKFMTPGVFREVVKRSFNVIWTNEELAAIVADYDNGKGNVDTQKFLIAFIKLGADERERRKAVQLERQRQQDFMRQTKEKLKLKQAEEKMALKVNYVYSDEEKTMAFHRLAVAAKKYDKAHPAAMSLQGFEEKTMKPHVFREMLKRTFNFLPTPGELGALMHFFDQKSTGEVSSHRFLVHFLKLGIAERDKEHKESLQKLREDEEFRERFHREQMAAQWAKAELNVTFDFTDEEKHAAMQKLADAAEKFDPASPGPMGLTAFQASVLSPAVFREMLKRVFNMRLTNGELAALIKEFDKAGNKMVSCSEFMVTFTSLGYERRSARRAAQLEKQRRMDEAAKKEWMEKQRAADSKLELNLESFTDEDFNSALNKIRILASNYDRSHPSAPSLQGFVGTDMKPNEFKHMMQRTFNCQLTNKELSALVAYFPSKLAAAEAPMSPSGGQGGDDDDSSTIDSKPRLKHSRSGSRSPVRNAAPRIDNKEFLTYFNKIQREEQGKRHKARVARDRDFIEMQKQKEIEEEKQKRAALDAQLVFTPEDVVSMVSKLKHALKEYTIDGAVYQEALQGYKGPALPPDKFRDLFYRIFNIKFTLAEVGVLLGILHGDGLNDTGSVGDAYSLGDTHGSGENGSKGKGIGLGVFDGPRFLTWFYKLSRIEEKFMLGESEEEVDLETLKRIAIVPSANSHTQSFSSSQLVHTQSISTASSHQQTAQRGRSRKGRKDTPVDDHNNMSRSLSKTRSTSPRTRGRSPTPSNANVESDPFADAFGISLEDDEEVQAREQARSFHNFSTSTLNKHWFLPSLVAPNTTNTQASGEMSVEEVESVRQHLHSLFTMSNEPEPDYNYLIPAQAHGHGGIHSSAYSKSMSLIEGMDGLVDTRMSHGGGKIASSGSHSRVHTAPSQQGQKKLKKSSTQPIAALSSSSASISLAPSSISSPSHAKGVAAEKDFLFSLFDEGDGLGAGVKAANSHDGKKKMIVDPVQHLLSIKKHFHQAPRYIVGEKIKKQKSLLPSSWNGGAKGQGSKVSVGGNSGENEGSAKMMGKNKHRTSTGEGSRAEDMQDGQEEQGEESEEASNKGGFFFPALLSVPIPRQPNPLSPNASVRGGNSVVGAGEVAEDGNSVVDGNNLGIVGSVSELSQDNLRQILLEDD